MIIIICFRFCLFLHLFWNMKNQHEKNIMSRSLVDWVKNQHQKNLSCGASETSGITDSEFGSWELSGVMLEYGVDITSELSFFADGGVKKWSSFSSKGTTVDERLSSSSISLFFGLGAFIVSSVIDFNTHLRTLFLAKAVVGPSSMYIGLALSDSVIFLVAGYLVLLLKDSSLNCTINLGQFILMCLLKQKFQDDTMSVFFLQTPLAAKNQIFFSVSFLVTAFAP